MAAEGAIAMKKDTCCISSLNFTGWVSFLTPPPPLEVVSELCHLTGGKKEAGKMWVDITWFN